MDPYPAHLVSRSQLPDGTDIVVRPIRPEDAEMEQDFIRQLSNEAKYFRFMQALQELTPEMLVRFTQIDYDSEMAFIATREKSYREGGKEEELGVARYVIGPDRRSCEFALVVSDQWQRKGLGHRLMACAETRARELGAAEIACETAQSEVGLIDWYKRQGYRVVGTANRETTNYVSYVLSKRLAPEKATPASRRPRRAPPSR